jgi:hypothetical protein
MCLDSIRGYADETVVFTWDEEQSATAEQYQANVIFIAPVDHVELVRQDMQTALTTDWVLMLDPDEVVDPNGLAFFRTKISGAGEDVVGFWVPYRMFFLGEELRHSFPNIKQLRLFRRDRVHYSRIIHLPPAPLGGRYEFFEDTDPGIEHRFVRDLRQRLERHLQWAYIEAQEMHRAGQSVPEPDGLLAAGLEEFKMYALSRNGLRDGYRGLVNALMHGWKTIATLCFLWELQQAPNLTPESFSSLEKAIKAISELGPSNPERGMTGS